MQTVKTIFVVTVIYKTDISKKRRSYTEYFISDGIEEKQMRNTKLQSLKAKYPQAEIVKQSKTKSY